MSTEIGLYIRRRVQELLNQNWSAQEIIQQLEAIHGKRIVVDTLAAVKSEKF